jgi:glucose-6-phosphate 1-dehydrogenase
LTKRLLKPAIYNLSRANLLPDGFRTIGLDRAEQSEEEYRAFLTRTFRGSAQDTDAEFSAAFVDETAWSRVESCLQYMRGDIDNPSTYAELKKEVGKASVVFYLAIAARFFGPVTEHPADSG